MTQEIGLCDAINVRKRMTKRVIPVKEYPFIVYQPSARSMSLQFRLIEFLDQGEFLTALVLEDANTKRLRILTQKGREFNIPLSRVVHVGRRPVAVGPGREERLRLLEESAEERKKIAGQIDIEEIYEVVREEGGKELPIDFLAELCFGQEPEDDQQAAFLRAVFADRLFFKYKDSRLLVHSEEIVEQLREKYRREEEKKALLQQGAQILRQLWQGKPVVDWPERGQCLEMIGQYYLFGNDAEDSDVAQQLLKDAGLTGPHDAYLLLVKAGIWDRHENIPLLRQRLPVAFSAEVLAAAASLSHPDASVFLAEGYRDLRHLPLITIDGARTRDRDDALHIERTADGYRVGVHIADVARYLPPDSLLFREAAQRISSIYFADGQIPMLPPSISEGLCSLLLNEERPVMSFLADLTPAGEVMRSEIVPALVTVKRQLTYEEVDALMGKDEELTLLHRFSLALQRGRLLANALILPFPDVIVQISEGEVTRIELAPVDTPGRSLVAEFMVLANSIAARYLAERAVPGLFRSQGPPGQRLVREPQNDLLLNYRQRKHLAPGQLSTEPLPHSGVGVPQYTTVTSPIRRFLDLAMQHQLFQQISGKGVFFQENVLRDFGGQINQIQGRINLVRQQRHRYWLLRYLERHIGRRFSALVTGKGPRRVQFLLPEFLLDADLPPNRGMGVRPGDKIMVKLAKASALDGQLRFEW